MAAAFTPILPPHPAERLTKLILILDRTVFNGGKPLSDTDIQTVGKLERDLNNHLRQFNTQVFVCVGHGINPPGFYYYPTGKRSISRTVLTERYKLTAEPPTFGLFLLSE